MAKFYKREAESDLGIGMCWFEVEDGRVVRQVEAYGGVWRWGDDDHPQWLSDQPESALALDDGEVLAIGAEEFEGVWAKAREVGSPNLDAELTGDELKQFVEMWRALREVLSDRTIPDENVREEIFSRVPRERFVETMARADRYLAATSPADGEPTTEGD